MPNVLGGLRRREGGKQLANLIVPLDNSPNQNFQVTVNVNGKMTISDTLGNIVLDSIPLITGVWPAANLLRQFQYLGIGSVYILNASGPIPGLDYPNNTDLGSDFVL